jgi:hypothetical protein
VYEIKCRNCRKRYLGQTKRRKDDREKEHDRAVKYKRPEKSALAAHCLETGHEKHSCRLIKEVNKCWELDAWESLFIQKTDETLLMNTGDPPIKSKLFRFARNIKN